MTILHRLPALILVAVICGGCVEQADVKPASDGMVSVKLALNWYPKWNTVGSLRRRRWGFTTRKNWTWNSSPADPERHNW